MQENHTLRQLLRHLSRRRRDPGGHVRRRSTRTSPAASALSRSTSGCADRRTSATPRIFEASVARRDDRRVRRPPSRDAGRHRRAGHGLLRRSGHPVLLERRRRVRAVRPVLHLGRRRQRVEPLLLDRGRARKPREDDPTRRASTTSRRSSTAWRKPASRGSSTSRTTTRRSLPHARRRRHRAAQVIWVPLLRFRGSSTTRSSSRASCRSRSTSTTSRTTRSRRSPTSCPRAPASTRPGASRPVSASCARCTLRSCAAGRGSPRRSCGPMTTGAGGTTTSCPPQVDEYGYGYRAPALADQPVRPPGSHRQHDARLHLVLEVHRGELVVEPLAERDAAANNIVSGLRLRPATSRTGAADT